MLTPVYQRMRLVSTIVSTPQHLHDLGNNAPQVQRIALDERLGSRQHGQAKYLTDVSKVDPRRCSRTPNVRRAELAPAASTPARECNLRITCVLLSQDLDVLPARSCAESARRAGSPITSAMPGQLVAVMPVPYSTHSSATSRAGVSSGR